MYFDSALPFVGVLVDGLVGMRGDLVLFERVWIEVVLIMEFGFEDWKGARISGDETRVPCYSLWLWCEIV